MSEPGRVQTHGRVLVRLGILAVVIVAALVVALTVPVPDVDEIRLYAAEAGSIGAIVFVLGYGVATLAPLPKSAFSVAAGLVWGFGPGFLLVYLGALLGAALAFVIGRHLGREAVERFTGARVARVDELLRRRGLVAVLGARLIPVLPFTVINYSAGLTGVRRRDYAIGTALGIVPGTLAYVALGAFGLDGGWPFWTAVGVLGILTLLGWLLAERARRRGRPRPAGAPRPPSGDETPRDHPDV